MSEHKPTSDTRTRVKNALSRETVLHLPLAAVASGVAWLAIIGWNHLDAAESHIQTNTHANTQQEKSIDANSSDIKANTQRIETQNVKQARIEAKLDSMADDIKEIKEAVKAR